LAAFDKALDMGAEAVEFDVQQTKDGRLAIIHDPDLRRVSGVKKEVGRMTYKELASRDVGSWFDPAFAAERVPSLEGALDRLEERAPGRVTAHVEIKDGVRPYAGIEKRVLDVLKSRPAWAGLVVVSSFNHEALRETRRLDSRVRMGYLAGSTPRPSAIREARELGCESLHLSVRQADEKWAGAAREAGLKALVYTVNTAAQLRRMRALGADGVFSDFPDLFQKSEVVKRR